MKIERAGIKNKAGIFRCPLSLIKLIGAIGFEPTTSRSRTERSTRLSHAPKTAVGKNQLCQNEGASYGGTVCLSTGPWVRTRPRVQTLAKEFFLFWERTLTSRADVGERVLSVLGAHAHLACRRWRKSTFCSGSARSPRVQTLAKEFFLFHCSSSEPAREPRALPGHAR